MARPTVVHRVHGCARTCLGPHPAPRVLRQPPRQQPPPEPCTVGGARRRGALPLRTSPPSGPEPGVCIHGAPPGRDPLCRWPRRLPRGGRPRLNARRQRGVVGRVCRPRAAHRPARRRWPPAADGGRLPQPRRIRTEGAPVAARVRPPNARSASDDDVCRGLPPRALPPPCPSLPRAPDPPTAAVGLAPTPSSAPARPPPHPGFPHSPSSLHCPRCDRH